MTIHELHIQLQPLINFLGEICLAMLVAAGMLSAILWILRRIWKFLLAAGALIAVAAVILLSLGVA